MRQVDLGNELRGGGIINTDPILARPVYRVLPDASSLQIIDGNRWTGSFSERLSQVSGLTRSEILLDLVMSAGSPQRKSLLWLSAPALFYLYQFFTKSHLFCACPDW